MPEEVTTVNNIREQAAGDIEELVQLTQRTRAFLDEHQGRLTTVRFPTYGHKNVV